MKQLLSHVERVDSFEDIRNGGDPMTVLGEAEVRIESAMRRYK